MGLLDSVKKLMRNQKELSEVQFPKEEVFVWSEPAQTTELQIEEVTGINFYDSCSQEHIKQQLETLIKNITDSTLRKKEELCEKLKPILLIIK